MTDFSINRKKAEHIVAKVLSDKPETRDDDAKLIMAVWEAQGLNLTPIQKAYILKCLSTETITRSRRKLQEKGMFKAQPKVEYQRSLLENDSRKYYGNAYQE